MRKVFVLAALMALSVTTGCMRTGFGEPADVGLSDSTPQPLEAQPVGQVQTGQLADPATDPSQFPARPVVDPALGSQNSQMAAANALDVKKETMIGNWKVAQGSGGCDMFLTLTNLGSGSRGATRRCTGTLTTMASWDVTGKQINLKDRDGNVIASIYKTAENRFEGSTSAGQAMSLTR